jgi:hypothetical protein
MKADSPRIRGSFFLLAVAALCGIAVPAQDRTRTTEGRRVATEAAPAPSMKNFRELNTTGRGRGSLIESGAAEQLVSRATVNLKRNNDAEIEIEGEMPASKFKGKWKLGAGETLNLELRQYRDSSISGTGRVILKNGAFSRLEINALSKGSPVVLNFDVRSGGATATSPVAASTDPRVGRFQIEIATNNYVVSLKLEDNRTVNQWTNAAWRNQVWDIESAGSGYYFIRSAENGQALTLDDRARDGVQVFTAPFDKSRDSQRWQFKDASSGQVYIISRKGRALEMSNAIRDLGTRLQTEAPNGKDTQKFKLLPFSGTPIVPTTASTQPAPPPPAPVPQGPPEGPGSMTWRGTVDGTMRIEVRAATVNEVAVDGAAWTNSTFQFTATMPRRPMTVSVSRQRGRGSVEIVQQPAEYNNYTAIVQIRDRQGGSDNYEFTLNWQ